MTDKHPNGYTKEMIRELLGTSCPQHVAESGCEERKRKGREMRAGLRPYPTYPAKKVGPNFDENGKYIYPEGSGFRYMDPNSEWGGKVS
tara:strand:- start:2508 stop:2774 length:267 start_codon:yes stop_codon:yes gene_type:complete